MNENEQEFLIDVAKDYKILSIGSKFMHFVFILICMFIVYFLVNIIIGGERIKGTNSISTEVILSGVTKEDIKSGIVSLYNDEIPKNYTRADITGLGVRSGDTQTPRVHLVYDYVGVRNKFTLRIYGPITDIGTIDNSKKVAGVQDIIVVNISKGTILPKFTNTIIKGYNSEKYKYLDRNNIDDAYFIKLAEDNLKNKTEYSSDYDIIVAINKEQSYIEVPTNYLN
ncbi:hypothetical protein D3C81_10870 [compost metagenome]